MTFTYSLNSIDSVSKELLLHLNSKIILFNGTMGAGKTTLIKSLVQSIGSKDTVTSPTFSIVNEYQVKDDKIFHFDFYRIKDIEEAYNFGVEDYLYTNHWVLIEWPQRIASILPTNTCIVDIDILDNKEWIPSSHFLPSGYRRLFLKQSITTSRLYLE